MLHIPILKILVSTVCLTILIQTSLSAQDSIEVVKKFKLKGNLNCVYKPRYQPLERRQFYPFSVSDSIQLVSFRHHKRNYPIQGGHVIKDSLLEVRTLGQAEVDQLTDILYNHFYKSKANYGVVANCFDPRNAILFYDRSGQLRESILLCFHCNQHLTSSEAVEFGSKCTQKVEKLRQFFVQSGLRIGTDLSIHAYPGEDPDE